MHLEDNRLAESEYLQDLEILNVATKNENPSQVIYKIGIYRDMRRQLAQNISIPRINKQPFEVQEGDQDEA